MVDPRVFIESAPGPGGPNLIELSAPWLWQPSLAMDEVHRHLAIALRSIELKRADLDRRWSYYRGEHDEKIISEKVKGVMRRRHSVEATMFSNYCRLAVEAPLSRLTVSGFKGSGTKNAQALWDANDLDLEAEEVHRHVFVAGEAFVIVWPRLDPLTGSLVSGGGGPVLDVAIQDARNMHIQYAARRRRAGIWAAKVFLDNEVEGEEVWKAILYYPDQIIRLETPRGYQQCPRDPAIFQLDPEEPGGPNPLGALPVVRFCRFFDGDSRLDDLISIQDRVNKLTSDKLVAAEFGAFPQRWALTNDDPPESALKAGPGSVWAIPPSSSNPDGGAEAPTTIGQFPTTDLSNYDTTLAREVNAFFTIAQLPRHLLVDPGVAPTGEAIKADEGPFVVQVQGYRKILNAAWVDVLKLAGIEAEPTWRDIEAHNELTSAQTLRELTTAGMPLRMAAEIAMDLPEDQLSELDNLPIPPQPGAGLPGQSQQGGKTSDDQPPASGPSGRGGNG